jgi:protein TonB
LLAVSTAYGQRPLTRPWESAGGGEGYIIVTDSMLIHEKLLYTPASLETNAEYPGGQDSFDKFLKKNLKYPVNAIKNHTEGKVFISFIVEKSGRLTNVKISRGIGDGCDEEAERLVKKSSKWRPGKIHNIPVRTELRIAITFLTPAAAN